MPIRHGRLFERIATLDALHDAYLRARRGKREKGPVQLFEAALGANLEQLERDLVTGAYRVQPYRTFEVREPKPRKIYAPDFRDVIVQHAIYREIYPIFDRGFIHDSYGCRIGKGTHAAADQLQRYLRAAPEGSYILQLDICKFFYRIDRPTLMGLIAQKIKDRRLLALIHQLVDYDESRGIPIGNLLSQIFSNVYMSAVDHHIKRSLRVRRYIRYVDDLVLIGISRPEAQRLKRDIEVFLAERLGLELSKWVIQPVRKGVNFVGYRTWRRTRFVRKHSLVRFSRRMKQGRTDSLVSILGSAQRTATFRHFAARLTTERPDLLPALPASVRRTVLRRTSCTTAISAQ